MLETERYAAPIDDPSDSDNNVRRLALLGKPVPGLEIRIVDPETGSPRAEREVGELEIRGTSVTPGYYGRPDLADELFHDGYLRTGDLAYMVDGELVVCGRIKDVIIVGGRNVFPEDVERAVATIDGVRAGNVIAFGVPGRGKEGVVVVAETRSDDTATTRRTVAERVRQTVGLAAEGHRARRAGHAAEDIVGQAAAQPVPPALPRRRARLGLTGQAALSASITGSQRSRSAW